MKDTENYEELLERFYKRTMQLEDRQADLEDAYQDNFSRDLILLLYTKAYEGVNNH